MNICMKRFARFVSIVVLIAAASGCAARYIRDVQDLFSRAAETELRVFAKGQSMDVQVLGQSGVVGDYRTALALVNREISTNEAELRSDRLYGIALMLKAYCLWRLADLDEFGESTDLSGKPSEEVTCAEIEKEHSDELRATLAIVNTELAAGTITLGERGRVMRLALPGLRDHDRGLRLEKYDSSKAFFVSALTVCDRALRTENVPREHPMRIYIRAAQLSTLRAWQALAVDKLEGAARSEALSEIKAKATVVTEELKLIHDDSDNMDFKKNLKEQVNSLAKRLAMDPVIP